MANKIVSFFDGIKSWFNNDSPPDNNDHADYRGIFINSFAGWSNSFDADRAYRFYDNARPLASTVDRISDAFAEIEPSILDRRNNIWITADTPGNEGDLLRFLKNPGFNQTYRQFASDLAVSFLLTRDGFFIMHGNINRPPLAMVVAKPFFVTEEEATDGYVRLYRFSKQSGSSQQAQFKRLKPSIFRFTSGNLLEIYHILGKTRNDGLRGRSPISALLWDLLQNVQGGQHNANLLKNSATPSGALTTDSSLKDSQFTRLKEQIDEQYSGALNAGRPMLLESGLKWEDFSISNKEMDYIALMSMSSDAIFDRYKVPLALVNVKSQTLDNYKVAVVTMYDDAVEPLTKTIYEGWEDAMFDRFDIDRSQFSLLPNPASINAAIVRQSEKMKRMFDTHAFTPNEIRAEDGFEPVDGGDVLYIPTTTQPVSGEGFVGDEAAKDALIKTLVIGGMDKKDAETEAEKFYGSTED